jgi:conjugative transfer relaxase protein TraI
MLSTKPLESAKGAHDYYTKTIEYYASDATAIQWLGSGKSYLNLDGPVESQLFLRLLEGHLPNGQKLQNPNGEHRPGFDMTFSAPKSVSLLAGLGVAPELIKFHDAAVKHAVAAIEAEFAQARISINGEIHYQHTNNLLVASFRQPSSRANDPALHTHCVVLNMTFLDGKARSLASDKSRTFGVLEQIQNHQRYCGLLYRHHLANSLKEAGFQLRLTGDGLFEIDGLPDTVLKEFSRRREDIERLMKERGWQGAKSASVATEITRAGKEEHTLQTLQSDWELRAKNHQFDAHAFMIHRGEPIPPSRWFTAIREKLSALLMREDSENTISAARASVIVAIETLSQRTSVFTERALLTESLKHSLVHEKPISKESIIAAIAAEKSQQNLYAERCKTSKEMYLTTPWLLTLEAETIARIEHNKNTVKSIATLQEVNAFQRNRKSQLAYPMTPSQIEAMSVLLTTQDRYLAIQGYAGTAKTTMLAEARLFMEEKGYQLRGIAVASSAANELQTKSGIRSDVFPVIYQALKNAPKRSFKNTIFIVDEASMLSSPQGHALLKHIERTEARLVLVGDKAQLPSVNNSRIFGLTQEYGIETVVITDIVRQKNALLKEAVIHTTRGEINEALAKLDIQALPTHEERIQWIAKRWLSMSPNERDSTLLFAPTHRDREAITHLIREGLKQKAELPGESWLQPTLKTKPMEAIQQRFVAYYQENDIIRFNQDVKRHGIQQNHYYRVGTISSKHRRNNILPLISDSGKTISFALKSLPQYKTHTTAFERPIEVYQQNALEMNVGDKLMWTRNFKAEGIRNGEMLQLESIQKDILIFKAEDGQVMSFQKNHVALQHLDYSYVLTNYKVQGKDAPFGIGLMESYHKFGATMKNFYVQISRAIHGMTLVTDSKTELCDAIHRNIDEKKAALDMTSSRKLKEHEIRFKEQRLISIQPVIEKKIMFEERKPQYGLHTIKELYFQKAVTKIPERIKELER